MTKRDAEGARPDDGATRPADPFGPGPHPSPEADAPPPTQPGPAGWETDNGDETTEAGH
ncbi:hypothetical protein HLB42_19810 (plasmid) [Deinococcus sp. D7000]|nr:hypothetical protein HLB42_19810 [Deinococcus sp. D7000]